MSNMKTFLRKEFNKFTLERFPNIYRPDSLPFISGDTFRKFSHHVFDETQSFDPKKVNNNEIIFINSDLIEIFFKIQDPKIQNKYILISHNSDKSPSKEELGLISEKIVHWFVQNLEFSSFDRISYLPIGLENKRWLRNHFNIATNFNSSSEIKIATSEMMHKLNNKKPLNINEEYEIQKKFKKIFKESKNFIGLTDLEIQCNISKNFYLTNENLFI